MSGIPLSPSERDISKVVQAVIQLQRGRINAVGEVTLALNDVKTPVEAPNCGPDSKIFLFPQTAAAATEYPTTRVPPTEVFAGLFNILHANNAIANRSFYWAALG